MNRTEEKKLKKIYRRQKRKQFIIILSCVIFFICMIYITDISTSKMLQKNDNKYAVYAKLEKDGIVRFDIAGKTIELYIKPFIDLLKNMYYTLINYIPTFCIAGGGFLN